MIKNKINISLFLILSATFVSLNAQGINFGDFTKPVPSESSLTTFDTTPASSATGIPNISLPLLSLASNDSRISASLSLMYHPNNNQENEIAGEAGAGWTLAKGGVITRELADELDESYYNSSSSYYKKNEFNDVYYYNLPTGTSGKFRFVRDVNSNTFEIVNLSANNIKIEYIRDNNQATLNATSFTITDTFGYKFLFSDYSQSRLEGRIGTSSIAGFVYKSAFYLTKIISPANVTLLTYEYQKDFKYKDTSNLYLNYQLCKLIKVTSPNMGSLEIQYEFVTALENSMSDPYSVKKAVLKNLWGGIISQYNFVYDLPYNYYKEYDQNFQRRVLTEIQRLDPGNNILDKTKIIITDNKKLRILNPGGGTVEYNFEGNEIFADHNTPEYLYLLDQGMGSSEDQSYQSAYNWDFNTNNSGIYTFQVTGTPGKEQILKFNYNGSSFPPIIPSEGGGFEHIDYKIVGVTQNSGAAQENEVCYSENVYRLLPGTYTLQILGTGTGSIVIDKMVTKPGPYRNFALKDGLRVKNIKYFNSNTDTQPVKTISYTYDKFDMTIPSSSGIRKIYQNVKIQENSGNGYLRYYYTDEGGFPPYEVQVNGINVTITPENNDLDNGMIKKQETYNEQNQILNSSEYTYVYEKKNLTDKLIEDARSVPVFTKKVTVLAKNYGKNGQPIQTSSETEISSANYQTEKEKVSLANGDVIETQSYYSLGDTEYTHLQNANILSVPVKTIAKKNGKLLSSSQVKYDNGSLRPTSTVVTNPKDGSLKTTQRFDAYDSEGNIRQYTSNIDEVSGQGVSTVVIWGYHKTLPIAKILGAKLENIGTLADDIIAKSDLDKDNASEKTLLEALDTFRTNPALKNFQITTYTYNPLMGATSATPPNGIRESYTYDQKYRLNSVINVNGNIVSDYKYNTKSQP
ncbi:MULTISPECIES: hypothetical protein [unclassified Chryseobacterium]|uniref:hypothetical protein n=1 Tax=unclassified Chryseobacterium TaxID=2593645 RepID=UPI00301823D5